jgi:hypothetical protein
LNGLFYIIKYHLLVMDSEKKIIKRMKRNRFMNSWWLSIFSFRLKFILKKKGIPSHTIGIFMNKYTSNKERFNILKNFNSKK